MRMSDWSSDVCSSDLGVRGLAAPQCYNDVGEIQLAAQFMIMQGLLEVRAVGLELPGELRKPRPLRRREVARFRDPLRIAGGEEAGGEAVGEQVIVADGPAEPRQQVATVGRDDAKELKADFGRRPVALLRLATRKGIAQAIATCRWIMTRFEK